MPTVSIGSPLTINKIIIPKIDIVKLNFMISFMIS